MRSPVAQSVLKHIRNKGMVSPGDRVAIAVSGGADSVALLRIFGEIRCELGVSLSVVHFDHQLRGEESDRDAEFVRDLASAHGYDFTLERENVAAAAKRDGWNLEDAARRLRYAFFQRVMEQRRRNLMAVAHTADDQAETVLSHLIRGTGPTGLGAIYPIVHLPAGAIIRPLLHVRRGELRAYLKTIGQNWREDSTNADVERFRARIRTQLLPILERDFSPLVVDHLSQLSRFAREEEVFWSSLVDERYEVLVQRTTSGASIAIADLLNPLSRSELSRTEKQLEPQKASRQRFLDASSRPLTERLIRRLYENVRGDRRGLAANHVEQVIRFATQSISSQQVELPCGILVERVFDRLCVSRIRASEKSPSRAKRETISRPIAYKYTVALPSSAAGLATVSVPEVGSRFCLKLIDWADSERETTMDSQTFDADSLRAPLILRNWRPGDAYTPCGRRQPRKLKQMLLAARVPAGQRRDWPVLESAGAVVWARGMPVADAVRVGRETRVAVEIAEEKL
jgi:tRNA(Ile)-lysidine synthase